MPQRGIIMNITATIIENFKHNAEAHNMLMNIVGKKDPDKNLDIITDLLIEEIEDRLQRNTALFEALAALEPNAIIYMSEDIESAIMKLMYTNTYVNSYIENCVVAAARDVLHF